MIRRVNKFITAVDEYSVLRLEFCIQKDVLKVKQTHQSHLEYMNIAAFCSYTVTVAWSKNNTMRLYNKTLKQPRDTKTLSESLQCRYRALYKVI